MPGPPFQARDAWRVAAARAEGFAQESHVRDAYPTAEKNPEKKPVTFPRSLVQGPDAIDWLG